MKKCVIMAIMMCFITANISVTTFAQQYNDMKIQKNVIHVSAKKQKNIAPEDYIPVLMYHHFESGEVEPGNCKYQ